MAKNKIAKISSSKHKLGSVDDISDLVEEFARQCEPLEQGELFILTDARTDARYSECHIKGSKLVALGTIHVPLDPEEQPEYRANRDIAEDHTAFARMCADAVGGRSFSNIVAEFVEPDGSSSPLLIIGGQHRFTAIEQALQEGVDKYHGIKVYFDLDTEQRLDVQLISNTNIAVSTDLLDRMYETYSGPELRNWCQEVGLLAEEQDFADRRQRGHPVTVRAARTFIANYFEGKSVNPKNIEKTKTTPISIKTGDVIPEWEALKRDEPNIWGDKKLKQAAKEFAALADAQRDYFTSHRSTQAANVDFAEKAFNYAVLSAWAYVAGMLHSNPTRLNRHFELRKTKNKDPLN
ncbi:MAG: hypothetical protein ACRD4B_10835, partial [Acidobacteriota bacterium]